MKKFLLTLFCFCMASFAFAASDLQVGIGVMIGKDKGELIVVDLAPNSSAQKAGVQRDDRIIEIDGKKTAPLDLTQCKVLLSGPKSTMVNLKIKRGMLVKNIDVERSLIFSNRTIQMTPKDPYKMYGGSWGIGIEGKSL